MTGTRHGEATRRRILVEIAGYDRVYGYPPTVRELAEMFECSVSTMQAHLVTLRREGRLTQAPRKPRTMRVVQA